jgi:Cytochrome P450
MILYPDVKRKAHEELDEVIGADQLPRFEDRKRLPYMDALCKEIQRWQSRILKCKFIVCFCRWRPVFPLGIAHGVIENDLYKKSFVPKGSVMIGNAWYSTFEDSSFEY